MNDKMDSSAFTLTDLSYGVLNNFQESGVHNSASRRRSSGQDYVNSALAAAYAKDALTSVNALYGIVVQVLNETTTYVGGGSRESFLKQAEYNKTSEESTNRYEGYSLYYKVYIPEIEPRPIPRSTHDPILYTYQRVNILDSVSSEHAGGLPIGAIVKVEYGDFQNLLDPTIVSVEGSIPPSFMAVQDPCAGGTLEGQFGKGIPGTPAVNRAVDNYVYQLKGERLGGSALPTLEPGDLVVGEDLNKQTFKDAVEKELNYWGSPPHKRFAPAGYTKTYKVESLDSVQSRLGDYYRNVGVTPDANKPGSPAWSAAFVSYVIGKVDSSFPKSGAHTLYAKGAKEGKGNWSLWMTTTIPAHGDKSLRSNAQIKANVGDVLIKPPTGARLVGPKAKEIYSHGDVVYKIENKTAYLAGGNLGNTAKVAETIKLDAAGNYLGFGAYELIVKKAGKVILANQAVTATDPDPDDSSGSSATDSPG